MKALDEAQLLYAQLESLITQWLAQHPELKVHLEKDRGDPWEGFAVSFALQPNNPRAAELIVSIEGRDLSVLVDRTMVQYEIPYSDEAVLAALEATSAGRVRKFECRDFFIIEMYQKDRTIRNFQVNLTLRGLLLSLRRNTKPTLPDDAKTFEPW